MNKNRFVLIARERGEFDYGVTTFETNLPSADLPDDRALCELLGVEHTDETEFTVEPLASGFADLDTAIAKQDMIECANCGRKDLACNFKPLCECDHLFERLTPGGTVPFGECRECGSFAHIVERRAA